MHGYTSVTGLTLPFIPHNLGVGRGVGVSPCGMGVGSWGVVIMVMGLCISGQFAVDGMEWYWLPCSWIVALSSMNGMIFI